MTTEMPHHFAHLLQLYKKTSLKFDLYTFFNDFIHVYSRRAGVDNPPRDKILMSTERPYHFAHLLQVSKQISLNLILYILFHVFIHVYSPGTGTENPMGPNFLYQHKPFVILVICCKFLSLNDFLTFFLIMYQEAKLTLS